MLSYADYYSNSMSSMLSPPAPNAQPSFGYSAPRPAAWSRMPESIDYTQFFGGNFASGGMRRFPANPQPGWRPPPFQDASLPPQQRREYPIVPYTI